MRITSENKKKEKKERDDRKNADNPLAALPEWLEYFKEHLIDRIACIRTLLRNQIRNVLRKWDQNQGSTVFILTSQRTGIAKSQMTKGPLQKSQWRSSTSC